MFRIHVYISARQFLILRFSLSQAVISCIRTAWKKHLICKCVLEWISFRGLINSKAGSKEVVIKRSKSKEIICCMTYSICSVWWFTFKCVVMKCKRRVNTFYFSRILETFRNVRALGIIRKRMWVCDILTSGCMMYDCIRFDSFEFFKLGWAPQCLNG